jgi:hypothetical protein
VASGSGRAEEAPGCEHADGVELDMSDSAARTAADQAEANMMLRKLTGPHTHPKEQIVGLVESTPRTLPHRHVLADVADYDVWGMILMNRIFGG